MKKLILKAKVVSGRWSVVGILAGVLFLLFTLHFQLSTVHAQTTEFTYQGKLNVSGTAASSPHDFVFRLCSSSTGDCTQSPVFVDIDDNHSNVPVTNGIFSARINFTAANAFDGSARWLEMSVRPNGSPGSFQVLSPRQPITSAPYAIKAKTSDALSPSCNLCVTNGQILSLDGSKITGQVPTGAIPGNLANYIHNNTSVQQSGGFNVASSGYIGNRFGVGTQTLGNYQAQIESFGFLDVLRVQKNAGGGILASFGENGIFNIDAAGAAGGRFTVFENGNVGIGVNNPSARLHVGGNVLVNPTSGQAATVSIRNINSSTFAQLQILDNAGNYRGYIGYMGATAPVDPTRLDTVEIGTNEKDLTFRPSETEVMRVTTAGTVLVNQPVGVPSDTTVRLVVNGVIAARWGAFNINNLQACFNTQDSVLARCTGSSIRFKENVRSFSDGLGLIQRLRPVYFDWKPEYGGTRDMGLIAEEVAKEEPLLAEYNEKGEIEGVKYARISVVLVNAVKEQQSQIAAQQKQIEQQQFQIDELKQLVCAQNASAAICKEEK